MNNKTLNVLVGDDQIGRKGSNSRLNFEDNYKDLPINFEYENDIEIFISKASEKRFDALLIDLNWNIDGTRVEGYRVLERVRDYCPIRVLHSGESNYAIQKGYSFGATNCIPKGMPPEDFLFVLEGKKKGE